MEEENVNQNVQENFVQTEQIIDEPIVPQASEEAVNMPAVEYAGFWIRFAAVLIDALVLFIPSIILTVIFPNMLGGFLRIALTWGYAIYMLNTKQATLGKMAAGIKVTSVKGEKPTLGKIVLRETIGKLLSGIIFGIGYLMAAFTEKKRALHDYTADTVVVYDPARKQRKWLVALSVFVVLILPIMAGIILASLSSARQKALEKADEAQQKAQAAQMQLQNQNQQ